LPERREGAAREPCAGFVLAGGASSRFGRDKALVQFGGETLLVRLCAVVRDATVGVTIVGDASKYGAFGMKCVADGWPGEGPLGGIITALEVSARSGGDDAGAKSAEWNLIVGCDMPFLTRQWLGYLVERAAAASEADVIVARSGDRLQPLCACWRTSAHDALRDVFERGVRKVTEAMKHVRMEVLDETHWKRFDSAERLFWNMNTPADYDEAKRMVQAERT
jgi:molybdopterin-guanine dinucleotide biosynthesis protein A